jgi:hypothetical protein
VLLGAFLFRRSAIGRDSTIASRLWLSTLGAAALVCWLANHDFFAWPQNGGFHVHEFFHYYLGAKYFPEVGYFNLYPCGIAALADYYPETDFSAFQIRDMHDHLFRTAADVLPRGPRCDGAFTSERWSMFVGDVIFFKTKLGEPALLTALLDYGFNPSPVWTLIARPIALLAPTQQIPMLILAHLDMILMLASIGAAGWAFGFQGLCLVAIAWSANPLSRYAWIGDAFLRHVWLSSLIAGICCLKKRRSIAGGILLAISSLVRIFPIFFLVTYALRALRRGVAERSVPHGSLRVLLAAALTAAVLLVAAVPLAGRGVATYSDFAKIMSTYSGEAFWNSVGLRSLLSYSTQSPRLEPQDRGVLENARKRLRREVQSERRVLHWGLGAGLLVLLFRALGRCEDWQAAALGFPLILVFTAPPGYYMSCLVPIAMLATQRPRLQLALLLALIGWCLANLGFYNSVQEFAIGSAIALVLAGYTLLELARAPAPGRGAAAG